LVKTSKWDLFFKKLKKEKGIVALIKILFCFGRSPFAHFYGHPFVNMKVFHIGGI
jgi:hypothetical protein